MPSEQRKPQSGPRHLRLVNHSPKPSRPKTRGDCANVPRPCPWSDCRYSLLPSQNSHQRPDLIPLQQAARDEAGVTDSCALDVADRGEHSFEEVGKLLGISRQGVQQIEVRALKKLSRPWVKKALEDLK